jgi:nicotinamide-nucleotide amidase
VRAVVVSIGRELARGLSLDTHSRDIARALSALGIDVVRHVTLDDDAAAIAESLRAAAADADVIVASGGLGPTQDDCTRFGLAEAMGEELVENSEAMAHLETFAKARGRSVRGANRVQALLPASARALPNPVGTAVGIEANLGEARVFCVPGVPVEMHTMFDEQVLPQLADSPDARVMVVRTVRTFGLFESVVAERLPDLMTPGRHPHVGTAVHSGLIDIHIYASGNRDEAEALVATDVATVRKRLGTAVFGEGHTGLEEAVAALLAERGATVALAESCTGGLVAATLVNVPGMSDFFVEGVVAYANASKVRALGVDERLIADHGAVSEPVARAMAEGVRVRAGADVALGITGVAGPGGGTAEKPVGTVWMALADASGTEAARHLLMGDRAQIRLRAAYCALNMLRLWLMEGPQR